MFLPRDPTVFYYGATWKSSRLAIIGTSELTKSVRERVKGLVDAFIKDYLTANPKEHPAGKQGNKPEDK